MEKEYPAQLKRGTEECNMKGSMREYKIVYETKDENITTKI